ncbi:MAG: transposase [Bacteroidota bacterium]
MDLNQSLLKYMFPEGTLDYFEVVEVEEKADRLFITLEEKNKLPEGYSTDDYESKDFLPEKFIEDFPIRFRAVGLRIYRRPWRHKTTGKTITRDSSLVMKGGKVTSEFASFLKALD